MITELTWQDLTPRLVVDDTPIPVIVGETFNITLSGARHCVGYKQFGKTGYTPCPAHSEIAPGKKTQCASCEQCDVSFTAKTGYGTNEQASSLLGADHSVYLAYFSDDIIKVGVAVSARREVRVREQGALACMFIGSGNGTVARNLERRIHTVAGFTEWVRLDSKLKALDEKATESTCRSALTTAYEKAKRLARSTVVADVPEFRYLYPDYHLAPSVFEKDIHLTSNIEPSARICGTIAGIIGKVIMIDTGDEMLALNSTLLAGFQPQQQNPNTTPGTSGLALKKLDINRQQSIFDLL